MRRLLVLIVFFSASALWADSITLKSGRVISGEILDEWEGKILMEVKKGITMIFDRKDVKRVEKAKPPAPPVKKPAVKKSSSQKEESSVSISTPTPPSPAVVEKASETTPAPAPAPAAVPAR